MDRRGEADPCVAKARERLVAAEAERADVDLDEVRLHLLELELSAPACAAIAESFGSP